MNPGRANVHGLFRDPILIYRAVRREFAKLLENKVIEETRRKYVSSLDRCFGDAEIWENPSQVRQKMVHQQDVRGQSSEEYG